ncbi:MAG: glutathione S-transferase family protein [Hoeflea sp.]|uniref:glutathione S-transferase family protein n=1 Tax=Hoeflea sp. TaxID=1940281 RepID=UPI003EF63363
MSDDKMITLYHGSTSVCSAKVRVGLAEKGLDWKGELLDLMAGEQFDPGYLALNPEGVVPTLVHGDLVVRESSLILEYIDDLSGQNRLMPADPAAVVATRHWLLKCLDIHAAINTLTYATIQRANILAAKTPEQIAAMVARIPKPRAAAKRRDILDNGLASFHLEADFYTLHKTFTDMSASLNRTKWLAGEQHSMADIALIAYVDRLDRLGFNGLWSSRFPEMTDWLIASRQRASYLTAIDAFSTADAARKMRADGSAYWPELNRIWQAMLDGQTAGAA